LLGGCVVALMNPFERLVVSIVTRQGEAVVPDGAPGVERGLVSTERMSEGTCVRSILSVVVSSRIDGRARGSLVGSVLARRMVDAFHGGSHVPHGVSLVRDGAILSFDGG